MSNPKFPPLSRDFFQNNPKIDQKDRLPYPEYRYTKYFWLINLNQACYTKEQAEYLVKLLRKVVLDVFTSGDAVAFAHKNHKWDRRFIGNNELQLAIEVGPKKGRVHAHLIQEIKHKSVINIDPQDIKVRVNEALARLTGGRVTNAFVSRKIHPSSKPLEEYIDKDNTPWRNTPQSANGIFTYTLVYDEERPNWEAYDMTPRPISLTSTNDVLNRFPGDVPYRGSKTNQPARSSDFDFFPDKVPNQFEPIKKKKQKVPQLSAATERALLKRSKRYI